MRITVADPVVLSEFLELINWQSLFGLQPFDTVAP